ncbi:MAG: hypothetical protein OXS28_00895 [Gammaproteobacteria bacterium]|nr:hypothetical protein [Gammaproteobacteria bacterium]
MTETDFDKSVFINCPIDDDFAPLLEVIMFCIVYAGLKPRLSSERLDSGESRLDKIIELISSCAFSVHDLSRCKAREADEFFRMNMPFEFGVDMGFRRSPDVRTDRKKFIIFEKEQYDLKEALSDIAGFDVEFHQDDFQLVIKKLRDFLTVEVGCELPGPTNLVGEYVTFLGWMSEKKMSQGLTEKEALELPTQERLKEMFEWKKSGCPSELV